MCPQKDSPFSLSRLVEFWSCVISFNEQWTTRYIRPGSLFLDLYFILKKCRIFSIFFFCLLIVLVVWKLNVSRGKGSETRGHFKLIKPNYANKMKKWFSKINNCTMNILRKLIRKTKEWRCTNIVRSNNAQQLAYLDLILYASRK